MEKYSTVLGRKFKIPLTSSTIASGGWEGGEKKKEKGGKKKDQVRRGLVLEGDSCRAM